jgi:GH25 family lysozyme M1 (1,4-beta-N-acetylmuramidase)
MNNRAPWLESHLEFEGVGAHELNPRYDAVDEVAAGFTVETPHSFTVPAFSAVRANLVSVSRPRLDGIDISHHQPDAGPMDLTVTHNAIVGGAFGTVIGIKATQSTSYTDPTFASSRNAAHVAGFDSILPYHWLSSTTDPVKQARHFLEVVGDWRDFEGVMLDDEEAGVTEDMSLAWLAEIDRELGPTTEIGVYTGAYVAGGRIYQSTRIFNGRRARWLAAYTSEAKMRALPGVAQFPPDMWQFSSGGPVPGVTGRCDMNRVDNFALLHSICPARTATPPATPPTTPPTVPPVEPSQPPLETLPPFTPPTLPNIPTDIEEYTGMAERIIMDKRYNEAIEVGNGAPRWITGEEFAVAKAAGAVVVDAAPHPSFLALAARAGLTSDNLTARG